VDEGFSKRVVIPFVLIFLLSVSCNSPTHENVGKQKTHNNLVIHNKAQQVKNPVHWKSVCCDSIQLIPKGKIKLIVDYEFTEPKDSEGIIVRGDSYYRNKKGYDSTGNIIWETEGSSDLYPHSKKNYFYRNGKLTMEKDSILDMDEPYNKIDLYLHEYDKQGKCVRDNWIFQYGRDGKKDHVASKSIYDKNGNEIEYITIGDPSWWVKFEYDSMNNQRKEIHCDGGTIRWNEFSYDEKGREIEKKYFEKDTCGDVFRTSYFLSGTKKEFSLCDRTGKVKGENIYYYDKFGNEIYTVTLQWNKKNWSEEPENCWETKYSYDNNGNWIKKEVYHLGKIWRIEERVIEYY
jgi:hypothetical protein